MSQIMEQRWLGQSSSDDPVISETIDDATTNNSSRPVDHHVNHDESTPLLQNGSESAAASNSSIRSICLLPGMILRAHAILKDGRLSAPIPPKEALSSGTSSSSRRTSNNTTKAASAFWIDIDADERDREELKEWLQQLKNVPPFVQARLAEPAETWSTQVLTFDNALLAVFRILPVSQASDDLAHMAALLLAPNLLLTFTSCPRCDCENDTMEDGGSLYAQALACMHSRGGVSDPSSSGALCAWLQFHVERTSASVRHLRSCTLAMDANMDRNIHSVAKMEVIEAKDQLLRVLSVAEEQLECIEALVAGSEAGNNVGDKKQAQLLLNVLHRRDGGTLGVLQATAAATERMALRLETRLSDLRQRHESHQQEGMNRRLAVLTVLSAVFLPLTLITGIWGMNFEYMPELKDPMAYPIALFLMLLIAVAMICFFWKTGWFD